MADKDNDEISLDFSSIKKWFKGSADKKTESEHPASHHSHDSHSSESNGAHDTTDSSAKDEVTFDLASLKKPFVKLFGSKEKHQDHPSSHDHQHSSSHDHAQSGGHDHTHSSGADKDEGIAISWSGVKKFIMAYYLIFLLIIPIYIAYDLRVQTVDLPVTQDWARDTIYNAFRGQISAQVVKQYPHLPEAQRNEVITQEFDKFLAEHKADIDTQIKNQAAYFKTRFNDEHGHTLLLDIDSYSYFRETRNLLTYGHNGNTLVNGTDFDTYILAPMGVPAGKNLHNYLAVWHYKIWHFFDKDIYLMKSTFYLPMLIYILAVIPAFMIATYYGGGFAGLVAGIIVAIHPAVLTRTSAGVTDTDVYQIFFPLWVVWIYLTAWQRKRTLWQLVLASLAGVMLGVYSLAWSGWWLIFYFIVAITLLHVVHLAWRHRSGTRFNLTAAWKPIKHTIYMLGLFIAFTAAFVIMLRDVRFFFGFLTEPFAFLVLKTAANANLWPNVYTTVAELNPISIQGAISQISFGSTLLFSLACLGILLTLLKRDHEGHIDIKLTALLAMWFISTLWASKSGVRFVGLAVPAFALAVGACFGILAQEGSKFLKRHMNIPPIATQLVIIVLLSLLLIGPVQAGYDASRRNIPLISDSWYQSLTKIKDTSAPNAIMTSWWDFGHWFKSIADRPTTFDGGTQNTPVAHWVGKILLTADEDQAIGILRMLDCGSIQGEKELEAEGFGTLESVNLLYSVFNMTAPQARAAYVKAGVPHPDAVLSYTHCQPPEAFFITSADMVGKSGVWAHFGSWNFLRSNIWVDRMNGTFEERVSDLVRDHGISQNEAENLQREALSIHDEGEANTWISPWPSYGGGTSCTRNADTLLCQNGAAINLTTHEMINSPGDSPFHSITYVDGNSVKEKIFPKYTPQDISIALVPSGDQLNGVVMQNALARSMFTRLFYLEGHGLSHFKRFDDRTSVLGERIIVWKVDWAGNETNSYYPTSGMNGLPGETPTATPEKNPVVEKDKRADESKITNDTKK